MTLEEYAARQAQSQQEVQQTQEPLTVEQVAAKLDAEKLHSLTAQLQEAIEGKEAPAAMLARITGVVFGTRSAEAAAVEKLTSADYGGQEMLLSCIWTRRKLLKQQLRLLQAQEKTIADELETLEGQEQDLIDGKAYAAALDAALIETLTYSREINTEQPEVLQATMIQKLEYLYDRCKGKPAAMGLLYGCVAELVRRGYRARTDRQQAFDDIKERIAAAIAS